MSPRIHPDPFEIRRDRLRVQLEVRKLPAVVISNLVNIFYLTGFRGSAGMAVFTSSEALLWVDPRYTLQAGEQAHGIDVVEHRGKLVEAAGRWLGKKRLRKAGYEDLSLTCSEFDTLRRAGGRGLLWRPAGDLVEELREVKEAAEIEAIREASRLTCEVLEEIKPLIRPGVSELDLAAEVEYRVRRKGGEGTAFETIVASGARAALPHARASEKVLSEGELVILDLGAILAAYTADMTRTFYLGNPPQRIRNLYEAVLEAQGEGLKALRAGARAGAVDSATRRVLARRGLARYFTHSTGHGVGLEVHERPRLGKGEKELLPANCVVTMEPGVYLEGVGGVRLEETVLVGRDGPKVLTAASRQDWIVI